MNSFLPMTFKSVANEVLFGVHHETLFLVFAYTWQVHHLIMGVGSLFCISAMFVNSVSGFGNILEYS